MGSSRRVRAHSSPGWRDSLKWEGGCLLAARVASVLSENSYKSYGRFLDQYQQAAHTIPAFLCKQD
ncbi:hypothetical protein D3C77_242280 [compost metagenome]